MIKREQLESILALNKEIDESIRLTVERDLEKYSQDGINITEAIVLKLSEICELIQVPLNDNKIGGFILKKNDNFYCFINTAQPRAFQNFVYLHELYHLLHAKDHLANDKNEFHFISDNVENDVSIEERKANYYASLIQLNRDALRTNYYHMIKDNGFNLKTTIFYLMHLFKATYKTIIIRLFEIGCIDNFSILFKNFNCDIVEIKTTFSKLGLDESIVEPSNITSIGNLDKYIKEAEEHGYMIEDFIRLNKERYYEIMDKITNIQERQNVLDKTE